MTAPEVKAMTEEQLAEWRDVLTTRAGTLGKFVLVSACARLLATLDATRAQLAEHRAVAQLHREDAADQLAAAQARLTEAEGLLASRVMPCPECEGSGRQIICVGGQRSAGTWPCPVCAGLGRRILAPRPEPAKGGGA